MTVPLYAAALLRWNANHSVREAALWEWAGLLLALVSVPLVLFGTGWKRYVFLLAALAEACLWLSMLLLLVQIS